MKQNHSSLLVVSALLALGSFFYSSGPALGSPEKIQSVASARPAMANDLRRIYNDYSGYLDNQWNGVSWDYSVPSAQYKETNQTSLASLRLQATFSGAYRFRKDEAAKAKMRQALADGLSAYSVLEPFVAAKDGSLISTSSFNDMIGLYLGLALIANRPDLFNDEERASLIAAINKVYPWALLAEDTENRALLGAAYGLAILRHPLLSFSDEDKKIYQDLIRQKVEVGLKSIGRDYIYREGPKKQFSLHYHLVSANMLAYLGRAMNNQQYLATAQKMFSFVHRGYPLGQLSRNGSARPRGTLLQTVFLRALGERFLGNKNWQDYWQKEKKGRGQIDKAAPGRLAWRDELDQTVNDDYSFISMAELLFW